MKKPLKLLTLLFLLITSITFLQATTTTENFSRDYCRDVTVLGGTHSITVGGVYAPWHRILYRKDGSYTYYDVCNDNCGNPQTISDLAAGLYIVRIEQSGGGSKNYCVKEIAARVTRKSPDYCKDVSVEGGVETITVSGVNAPWHRIQYRKDGSSTYSDICNDNCSDPQTLTGVPAGLYIIKIQQSSGGDKDYCEKEIAVNVKSRARDYCKNVSAVGGIEEIVVSGVHAPWNRIQYRKDGYYDYYDICNDNCANPQGVSGIAAGTYIVRIEQSGGGDKDYCVKEIAVHVKRKAIDFCKNVSAVGGVEEIVVSGVHAPWNRIQYRRDGSYDYYDICNDNCANPQGASGIAAGTYIVRIEQSGGGDKNYCVKEITVIVKRKAIDFCKNVSAVGGVEEIVVSGVHAPWNRIQYRRDGSYDYYDICNDNCANPQGVSGIAAGTYIVRIEQSGGGDKDYCVKEITVHAKRKAIDYCKNVSAVGGVEEIVVSGVHAPWNRIQYRRDGSYDYYDICNDNCANPQGVSGIAAGTYIVRIEQSGGGDKDYCVKEIAVIVTKKAKDYCKNVSVLGGVEKITIKGVHAPWNRITYRKDGYSDYYDVCDDFCGNPEMISGLAAGKYIVKIEQSSGYDDYCVKEIAAIVTKKGVDYCGGVTIAAHKGKITISGIHAPWNRVLLNGPSTNYKTVTVCNDNCYDPYYSQLVISHLIGGHYTVIVEQSSGGNYDYCKVEETHYVKKYQYGKMIGEDATDIAANLYNPAKQLTHEVINDISLTDQDLVVTDLIADNADLKANHNLDSKAIILFPNPAQSELNVTVASYAGQQADLVVVNQVGAVVEMMTIEALPESPLNIDVSAYTNGLYFLRIQVAGSDYITKKFMVRK